MSKKLYVGNLPFQSTQSDLETLASPHGTVVSATVIMDKMTNRSRGFGFIEMSNETEATQVRDSLNGTDFQGRSLKIDLAHERTERSGGDRGNGGGYRGNSGGNGYRGNDNRY